MQSLLFLLEEADAQRHIGKPHLALKKYMAVKMVRSLHKLRSALYLSHRSRCLMRSKMINLISMVITCESSRSTFTSSRFLDYILKGRHTNSSSRLLSWENQLRSQPDYVKAAIEASKVCIQCVV